MDQDPESIPFLSTKPAGRRDRLWALGLALVSLIGLAAILPFAQAPWPRLVAFVPADDTGLILIYMITAMLLLGQFVQVRRRSLLALSSGYMFACLVVIAHLLSYAEVLRSLRPQTANDQTTAWLFVVWHGAFPLFVLIYALTTGADRDRPIAKRRIPAAIAASVAAAFALTAILVSAAAKWAPQLPRPLREGDYSGMVSAGILPAVGLITLAALATLYLKTRARRVLDLWMCVVLFAWLLDIFIGGIVNKAAYAFGWYAARIYSLVAASVVMGAMLVETGQLYARLTRALEDIRIQSEALSQSEAALRQAQKMEAIGQITGGIAHDFNNLLTVIIGSLDLLKRGADLDARASRLSGFAMEAAVRGERLTKQLLAFSRRQVTHPQTVSVDRLIRDFEQLLSRAVGGGVRIDLDLGAGGSLVRVDPGQFEAAMLNLAVNARDAMNGLGAIGIRTRSVQIDRDNPELRPGNHVMVSVADTGCGMDETTLAHVFEPFFTTKAVGKGSGLGLSQVYGFIKGSGGHVAIESEPGVGTTVRLYLQEIAGKDSIAGEQAPADAEIGGGRGERILVVEDDPIVMSLAADTLSELGYEIECVSDGVAALRRLGAGPGVDLLFSDIMMPGGMNGIELAREARRVAPETKILLTSGYAQAALDAEGSLPQGIEILSKPYRQLDLTQRLRQLLEHRG